jgi:arylsulfatase A-like enzyme
MFKRYSYQGGVADPLVISWPAGIKARGGVRSQYHHSVDIMPTILEACGVEMPEVVNGYRQAPLSGISMAYTFEGDGLTRKQTQYYEMLGTRGIWHQGWKAVAEHGPFLGRGRFEEDRWQLFHTDQDRSEAHDLAEELKALWFEEARANDVLPLSDLGAAGTELEKRLALEFHVPVPPSDQYTYDPGVSSKGRDLTLRACVTAPSA